ncbi:MAG: beta-galactosidase GalB [Prolixibacteraceae bacterium]
MKKKNHFVILFAFATLFYACVEQSARTIVDFTGNWKFNLGNDSLAFQAEYNDAEWRTLNLPHDWSIEGEFGEENTSGQDGGGLPAGIAWYRKSFTLATKDEKKTFYIDFDGVYRNSEVWINDHYLGKRPFGYIGFRYELTPYLNFGETENVLAVKVDNSLQPNSRWYTGSGIYRNVWLVSTGKVHVDHWGTFVTTSDIQHHEAKVKVGFQVKNSSQLPEKVKIKVSIIDTRGYLEKEEEREVEIGKDLYIDQVDFLIAFPQLWSFETPSLYQTRVEIYNENEMIDVYETTFGIRDFSFSADSGFFLNGENIKLKGVNNHHDLGALGAAFNTRAAERHLEILKEMGCNAIRMSHNPPAPELLDLCDKMGFFVMDEAFDCWAKKKMKHDYHDDWEEWHTRDLQDMILRDRNHPSVMVWSIGNEIREQFDSAGLSITPELVNTIKVLDTTRSVTCALTENIPDKNFIYQSKALDVLSFNYKHRDYADFPNRFPGEAVIASENMSAYASRGCYDMPSDSVRIWPAAYKTPIIGANDDLTCSAYDNVHAYWGARHEDTWKTVKQLDFISGMFIWSGFDYIGEPTPYPWPARSSYFGVIDLAGFPKDSYYFYQSEWSNETMLHLFPHWNWNEGQTVDVVAYYNNADEVELFVNGESKGIRHKTEDQLHAMWRVSYQPGNIKAITRKDGAVVLEKQINTAGEAAKIELIADRNSIAADGKDLSFVTVKVLDKDGNLLPKANDLITFKIDGGGFIAGTDNGYQASLESFKGKQRKAFNGMCLAIVQSNGKEGNIKLEASAKGLETASIEIISKPVTSNQ